ncbi:sporulation histidine kinase inhibitor Sda [Halalkalibacter okhensis]|nr:sporulation histidine kinase inhibitor Sda [Halalkalibacter okhensis]
MYETKRTLANVDKEILIEARNKAIKLQLDQDFISLLNHELNRREKRNK